MVEGVFATDMRYHQTHCERLRAMIDSAADHQVVTGGDPTAPAATASAALAGPLPASLARVSGHGPAPRHRLPACSTRMLPLP